VEKFLEKIKGYYTILQILLLIAFMSLCRIKTVEKLRGRPPGEFGKLLGLDRITRCSSFFRHSRENGNPCASSVILDSGSPLRCALNDGHPKKFGEKT
jgi:hypothetical protein